MTVLTCLWKRPELSALVMRYYAELGLNGVAVRSPGDEQQEIEGWRYVEHPNRPLGKKFNRGLKEIQDDDVMVVGSDDFVSEAYINEAKRQLEKGLDIIEPRGHYVYDYGRLTHCLTTPGAGRVLSKAILRKKKWHLWENERNEFLDASAMERLQVGRPKRVKVKGTVLDVKSDVNIWRLGLDNLFHRGDRARKVKGIRDADVSELEGVFPAWVLEEVFA